MLDIILIIAAIIVVVFVVLFIIYFFNLDMKLAVNVIAPFIEKRYDKKEKKHYL